MSDNYEVRCIRNISGDPYVNLQAAILYQAYSDYAGYCKLASNQKPRKKDLTLDPIIGMKEIREYFSLFDDEHRLLSALDAYLKKRHVRDMLKQ